MLNLEKIEKHFPKQGALCAVGDRITVSSQWLHDFARNVAEAEREACADIAENFSTSDGYEIAHNIRMRSNTNQTPCQPAHPLLVGLERD